jgi:hypothetical protein
MIVYISVRLQIERHQEEESLSDCVSEWSRDNTFQEASGRQTNNQWRINSSKTQDLRPKIADFFFIYMEGVLPLFEISGRGTDNRALTAK